MGRDVVDDEARQAVARRLGGLLPDRLGQAEAAAEGTPPVHRHVADDERHDGVVGEDAGQVVQDLAQEVEVGGQAVGIVEGGVDGGRVDPQEPQPQPVVVAVLDDPHVGRAGHHQPGAVGQGPGPQRRPHRRRASRASPRRAPPRTGGTPWR